MSAPADIVVQLPRGRGRRRARNRDAPPPGPPASDSATIRVDPGCLPQIVDACEALLAEPGSGVFQRGGALVEIARVATSNQGQSVVSQPEIRLIDATRLADVLTRAARWETPDKRYTATGGYRPCDCPPLVAKTVLARPQHAVPALSGVVTAPTLREDGTVVQRPGFDPESGLYLELDGAWPAIPEAPSRADAEHAMAVLEDVNREFPWASTADRAVHTAALITGCIRASLPTAPLFAISAAMMGSGKTLAADVIALVTTGAPAAAMTQPKDEEEYRKRLFSAFLAGDQFLLIDNVSRPEGSDTLCIVTTLPRLRDRVLSESLLISVSTRALIVLTGNNLVFRGDLSTRVLEARIDPVCERPEERRFERDNLRVWVLARRRELVAAALTIARAFECAGRPGAETITPFGRFELWSDRVRAALLWLGRPDPCGVRARIEQSDPVREQLGAIVSAWSALFGDAPQVLRKLEARMHCDWATLTENEQTLFDALMGVAGEGARINTRRLGKWIASVEGRVSDGWRFERAGERQRAKLWRLARVRLVSSVSLISTEHGECKQDNSNNTAQNDSPKLVDSPLPAALLLACETVGVPAAEIAARLLREDLDDIEQGDISAEQLIAFVRVMVGQLP